jgi:hypothetical protein
MTSSRRAAGCPGTCHAASTHPKPLPKMRRKRETCPRRQTRQTSHNVTTQLTKSVSPMCPEAVPAACPRGPDEAPARRRSTYNPRTMAGLARQMASARCSVRGASCRVITVTAGFFFLDLDVLPKWHEHLPGHPGGPGLHAATGEHYTVGLRQTATVLTAIERAGSFLARPQPISKRDISLAPPGCRGHHEDSGSLSTP